MSRRFNKGLVVGKFCPLHRGHQLVIDRAIECCHRVIILSYTNPEFPRCEPAARRRWLGGLYPGVDALVLEGDIPPNDAVPVVHREFVSDVLAAHGHVVDAVFTSEAYGEPFARVLEGRQRLRDPSAPSVTHVSVDAGRVRVPISGTALRKSAGPFEGLLSGVVAADLVQRVCFLGGESTGKSTLAQALGVELQEPCVPEYGRELWELREGALSAEDLADIAREQVRREEAASLRAHRLVVCDTSPLATLFYSLEMFGVAAREVEVLAERRYDLVVLCGDDIPFSQDGTRRDATFRSKGQAWYRRALASRGLSWMEAVGSVQERVQQVLVALGASSPPGVRYDPASPKPAASERD